MVDIVDIVAEEAVVVDIMEIDPEKMEEKGILPARRQRSSRKQAQGPVTSLQIR